MPDPLRLVSALALGLALAAAPAFAQPARVALMATGAVTGAYFPAGVALCRVVNETRREHGLRCSAALSAGSVDNLGQLRAGAADLAIVQSDAQADALNGAGPFEGEPYPELRAVAALYPEPLTLVVRGDAGIAGLGDLPGKRVNLGPEGSGQRALIAALMDRLGWREGVFAEAGALDPGLAVNALCEGRIDAFFYVVGHPALAIAEATSACGGVLAPVAGPEVDALVAGDPRYFIAEIPGGLYAGAPDPAPSFAVGATLVTRAETAAEDVEILTGAILDNRAALAGFDATLAALDPAEMPRRGLAAPLHPGAEAAYRARGLLD